MKPLAITRKKVTKPQRDSAVAEITNHILSLMQPQALYLFGSAVTDHFTNQSDIDFLVVCEDSNRIKEDQKRWARAHRHFNHQPELVWVTREQFDKKKDLGGVCMIAHQSGRLLFTKQNDTETTI